jgi:hypothetical protein
MAGLDAATGEEFVSPRKWGKTWDKDECDYTTSGPATVREVTQSLPEMPKPECYIWSVVNRCSDTQVAALANGTAVVKDSFVISPGPDED